MQRLRRPGLPNGEVLEPGSAVGEVLELRKIGRLQADQVAASVEKSGSRASYIACESFWFLHFFFGPCREEPPVSTTPWRG